MTLRSASDGRTYARYASSRKISRSCATCVMRRGPSGPLVLDGNSHARRLLAGEIAGTGVERGANPAPGLGTPRGGTGVASRRLGPGRPGEADRTYRQRSMRPRPSPGRCGCRAGPRGARIRSGPSPRRASARHGGPRPRSRCRRRTARGRMSLQATEGLQTRIWGLRFRFRLLVAGVVRHVALLPSVDCPRVSRQMST
jgi:hypothetical protein